MPKMYRWLRSLASPFHATVGLSFMHLAVATIRAGCLRTGSIATRLAEWTTVRRKSAFQRLYRFLGESTLAPVDFWSAWAFRLLSAAGRAPIIAVDWTEWPHGLRVLSAALVIGRRAIPICMQTARKAPSFSQNLFESTFLRLLTMLDWRIAARAILTFDRGFRRVSFLRELQKLGLERFIVRLVAKVHVQSKSYCGLLAKYPWPPRTHTQIVSLGMVRMKAGQGVTVRVIGLWMPGQKEPWWLATNMIERRPERIAQIYAKRMDIEEAFRDTKGARFGAQMEWSRIRKPEALDRYWMLATVALAAWTLAGCLMERDDPSATWPSAKKGPRYSHPTLGADSPQAQNRVLRMSWHTLDTLWPHLPLEPMHKVHKR